MINFKDESRNIDRQTNDMNEEKEAGIIKKNYERKWTKGQISTPLKCEKRVERTNYGCE